MGGRIAPPADELFSPAYAKRADRSDIWWRNIFENPTTVQFDHRVLVSLSTFLWIGQSLYTVSWQAMTTYLSTCLLYLHSRRKPFGAFLPPAARASMTAAFVMANVQVLLGLATLLYLVPVPVAASHQAGSVALLTTMISLLVALRRPTRAAQLWRNARVHARKTPH